MKRKLCIKLVDAGFLGIALALNRTHRPDIRWGHVAVYTACLAFCLTVWAALAYLAVMVTW